MFVACIMRPLRLSQKGLGRLKDGLDLVKVS